MTSTATSRPDLLTTQEVADALRVSTETIRRHVHEGAIAAVRLGTVIRIPVYELERLLADVAATRR
jgi:excisionase family DNA binding protein